MRPYLVRKEIAVLTGLSVRTVVRHEDQWKLNEIRINVPSRSIRYDKGKAILILTRLGFI